MIHWRPATKDDIGMLCRFFDVEPGQPIKQQVVYGLLHEIGPHPLIEGDQFVCEYGDEDLEPFIFAEVAEQSRTPIEDPIGDIRIAVANTLRFWVPRDCDIHKRITDSVADHLPDYFRQPLYREDAQ